MANVCSYAPSKGTQTFYKLKKELGYERAWRVLGVVMNPQFQEDFRDTLSFDAEGVPTYSSIMQNSYIQKYIGDRAVIDMLQREYTPVENTIDNYQALLEDANRFNKENPSHDRFTAIVDYEGDKLTVRIVNKTEQNDKVFQNQYMSQKLNRQLADILSSLGINIGTLTQAETDAGRVGVTDFSKARRIATDTISMIKVANNREGAEAISEEFSHMVIGALRNNPLVERSINLLSTDETALRQILGDEYEDTVNFQNSDISLVAEEALGKLLQNNLKLNVESKSTTLLNRFINFIKNMFKRISQDRVQDAITEADGAMSNLAKSILKGKQALTKQDIIQSQRDVQFNALSDRIERNIEILKKSKETEIKRARISSSKDAKTTYQQRVDKLNSFIQQDADTVEGLLTYSKYAVRDLRSASSSLAGLDTANPAKTFQILRGVRSTIQSYRGFITSMNDAVNEETDFDDNMFLKKFEVNNNGTITEIDIPSIVSELNNLMQQVDRRWMKVSKEMFSTFLKPILGEEITIEMGKHKGEKVSVRKLLDVAEKDISFLDRWLDAMGDSSDILLQAFDAVVKRAVDNARYKTIDEIREIQALRMKAESYGIRDFEWMFEKYSDGSKTGNYISERNNAQFQRDYAEFLSSLDKKYGKNAKGEALRQKQQEKDQWLESHAEIDFMGNIYAGSRYNNQAYKRLNSRQREILDSFLELKSRLDKRLPSDRVSTLKAVQMRKNGTQRFIDSASSPKTIWNNIQNHLKDEWLDSQETDDELFGDQSVKKGLTDFSGREFMILPALYTTSLRDPNELSTDVFGTLMAYSAMSNRYEQMEKVIDPLEVGRSIITDGGRRVKRTRGGNQLVEKIQLYGNKVLNETYEEAGTNIEKRLEDFFECQVYQRYLKDQGSFNMFGKQINKNKVVSNLLKYSSFAQLGFNFLANIANVSTGVAMQNIEAAAGEFFNARELARADAAYLAALKDFMAEIGARDKTSKLALIDEYFNIKGEFNKNMKFSDQRRSLLRRLFGNSVAFLGQECGDHWLYNRTSIAMMLREKVNVPGKGEISLWDALQVVKKDGIAKLALPEGTTDSNGNPISIGSEAMAKFSRKMLHVNQSLFGIYNDDDANAANRVAVGRMIMQYRKWMKAQYNKRFQAGQQSLALGQWEEGYYRTAFRFINELARGKFQVASQWDNLTPHEKANVRRAMTEMIQTLAVWLLANVVEWSDDKDRPWAAKLAEYTSKRAVHELGNLTPSTIMVTELLATVKSPAASLSLIGDVTRFAGSCVDPRDWTNEIQSGPYKDWSTWEKNFYKLPLPVLSQYKQVNKFVDEIDTSLQYYARPK